MNKIIVNKNIIISDNQDVIIDNNKIIFMKSLDYEIEYIDSDNISLEFVVDNVCVKLLESSFNNNINVCNKVLSVDFLG